MPDSTLTVAIVGAESTGKSRLAVELQQRLRDEFGLVAARVDEYLREWCAREGRTPRADEQAAIAHEQQRRIEAAARAPDVDLVLCDTTPLMTAVYSELLFEDDSLDAFARQGQQRARLTLLTALDLPWVADGLQRDGPHVRTPVDLAVRRRLLAWELPWSLVQGQGAARVDAALAALRPLLDARARHAGGGLFTQLQASGIGPPRRPWVCTQCDDPDCEHRSRRQATP